MLGDSTLKDKKRERRKKKGREFRTARKGSFITASPPVVGLHTETVERSQAHEAGGSKSVGPEHTQTPRKSSS